MADFPNLDFDSGLSLKRNQQFCSFVVLSTLQFRSNINNKKRLYKKVVLVRIKTSLP